MRLSQQQPGGELPLSLHDISSLFGNALMRRGASSHRNYPSGGALYPIETYLVATLIEGVSPGVFHYHPTDHVLERLWGLPPQFELTRIVSKPSTLAPTALVVFTSVWERSAAKYGDFAYGLSLEITLT
jgi:SagB-type dehydrogenase family enzyme